MKVLIVKTSSLGDVIHTLPALTDAAKVIPDISFDWMVEAPFAEIPQWHSRVERVIPIAWRKWRQQVFAANTRQEFLALRNSLKDRSYDLIIDAQGLVKSALLSTLAKGKRAGLDWGSAREPLASLFYGRKCQVDFYQHAIVRMRSVFAKLLGYPIPETTPEYGIDRRQFIDSSLGSDYLVFLHGTTWDTKLWPEEYWLSLAKLAARDGLGVKLLWGNAVEEARANRLAAAADNIVVMPRQNLLGSAKVLANARSVVALDTGLAHLAAALDVPTVSLYGPTNPDYTGALGRSQICLAADFPCAPCYKRECTYPGKAEASPACFTSLHPQKVWETVSALPV